MTKLDQLIDEVRKMPAADQERVAEEWLEMLHDDARWDDKFAGSGGILSQMAAKARKDVADGKGIEQGWDQL